jgi:hypothetical protein
MQASLKVKANWVDQDIAGLSTRLTNGRREISIAMSGWPTHQSNGPVSMTVETVRPTIMLYSIDADGRRHEVTETVLGDEHGDEYYPEKHLKAALKWLTEDV